MKEIRNRMGYRLYVVVCVLLLIQARVLYCEIETTTPAPPSPSPSPAYLTFIQDAQAKGAVCLDGSPGAYYFSPGFGDGLDKWIVYLPGGGWCNGVSSCYDRYDYPSLGTTNSSGPNANFNALQNADQHLNPDFYNWNQVKAVYCDGASFMADVEAVDPVTNFHLRGGRIFRLMMEELISAKGMDRATNAILGGDSAGGLATILNCDRFRSYLPSAARVKCFSDSGFFIRAKDFPGSTYRESYYGKIVEFHGLARVLPESCTSRMSPNLCLFPENLVGDVQTPIFLVHSAVDQFQITYNVWPNPPNNQDWRNCTLDFNKLQNCTSCQIKLIMDFQIAFVKTLEGVGDNPSRGLYINSCYIHGFLAHANNWLGTPILQNKSLQQAFGDWYMERSDVKLIDLQQTYPLNCRTAA